MPYETVKDDARCPAGKPWGVDKKDDGSGQSHEDRHLGCHPSESSALEQIAALEASERDAVLVDLEEDLVAAGAREKVARRQQAERWAEDIDRLTVRVLPVVEAALEEVADRFAPLVASAEPIDQYDTQRLTQLWAEASTELVELLAQVYTGSANRLLRDLGTGQLTTQTLRAAYLETAANRLTLVGDDLWKESAASLAEGVRNGEDYRQLRDRLRTTFAADGTELGASRAMRIARTEVQAAVNRGTQEAVQSLPEDRGPQYKTWLAADDSRTRPAHAAADNQTVLVDEPFLVNGELLMYPGDPAGSAANTIQCRCAVAYLDAPGGRALAMDLCGPPSNRKLVAADDDGEACAILDDPSLQSLDARSFAGDRAASQSWVEEHYEAWRGNLSPAQVRSIKQYQGDNYTDLNKGLRRGADADPEWIWNGQVADIDSAISQTRSPTDVLVHRQVKDYTGDGPWARLQPGDEFVDNGYVSTSLSNLDPTDLGTSPGTINMRITVKRGQPAAPIARVVETRTGNVEDELLLPRGTRFRVTGVGSDGSLDLEVIT